MKNMPMTPNRAFIVNCRIESDVDERELVRLDASDEVQISDITPAEHACSEVLSSNVGKLPWTAGKGSEKLWSASSVDRSPSPDRMECSK